MKRWLRQSPLWSAVIGTIAAFGLAVGQDAPSGPPKVGAVISLKFRDGPDRQFTVIKVDKQPDGSYLSEVKDVKTGETITLLDRANEAPVAQPMTPKVQQPLSPKTNDPLFPTTAPPDSSTKNQSGKMAGKPNTATGVAAMPDQTQDPPKKPGLFARIFGPKKPNPPPPAKTNSQNTAVTNPSVPAPGTAIPPATQPVPGLFPPPAGGTSEPPRVLPIQPIAPPPLFPTAPPPPLAPVPPPLTLPPAPMIPGLPSIPIPPNGMSSNSSKVIQARYSASPATAALVQDIEPYLVAMRTARTPSERIFAMRALAGCRHASTDTVKSVLFHTCTSDPCPLVRACSIDELCNLGYYDPAFLAFLNNARFDPSEDVKDAAKAALKKMSPQRNTVEK